MYAEALVMTAIEENVVLVVPDGALACAAALVPAGHQVDVDVRLDLPCTVVDALDTAQARAVAALYNRAVGPVLMSLSHTMCAHSSAGGRSSPMTRNRCSLSTARWRLRACPKTSRPRSAATLRALAPDLG